MALARPSVSRWLIEPAPLASLTRRPDYRWLVVGTVCIGAFLGQLDASIATLVLPTLEDVFGAPLASVEWVAIAYLVTLAALVVAFGRVADLGGRKLVYDAGFVVFVVGSLLCALSPNLGWLIAFRVLQAVGAAMLQANSVALIATAVPRHELGRAIGIQAAAQAIGLAVGPSVGGALIAAFGWRWVFFIAVPIGLIGAALARLTLPRSASSPARRLVPTIDRSETIQPGRSLAFDWPGALMFSAAVTSSLLLLTLGGGWGWQSPRSVLAALLAVSAVVAFLAIESRAAAPLVDLTLFRRRAFTRGIVTALLSYAVLFGGLFLVPFYLQRIAGLDAAHTGLLLTTVPAAIGLMSPLAGLVVDRHGPRLTTVGGMLLSAIALALLAALEQPSIPVIAVLLALFGAGLGCFTPANNATIMGSAPDHRVGVAGGVLNMTRSLGTSLGVAVSGAILGAALAGDSTSTLEVAAVALLPGVHLILYTLAAVALLTAAISLPRTWPNSV